MLSFVSSRVGRASTTVLAIAVLALGAGAPAAQAAPLEEEVTTEWVCELQPHRVTDFRVFNGTAAIFTIEKFDESLGTFRSIEVTQEISLIADMSLILTPAGEETRIAISTLQEFWTNIPPEGVIANYPPAPVDRSSTIYGSHEIAWADRMFTAGTTAFDTRTFSNSASFSSADSAIWSGAGEQNLTLQTLTSIEVSGFGGNVRAEQQTTAEAEVCYRYTYVPVADELDPEPTPEPEADPDPEPTVRPEPKPRTLPDTGITDSPALALAAASAIVAGALLLSRRHHRLPILRRLAD